MQQAQQPFKGKNPPGIVGGGRQAAGFGDDQLGLAMLAADADLQVGQDQAQETAHACQRLAQSGGGEAAAAEEFETADTHRLGKQTESLVVECPVQQVIQCGIAIHGNSAGVICKIEADLTQEIFCVDTAPIKPG